jgi:hypothetical protein
MANETTRMGPYNQGQGVIDKESLLNPIKLDTDYATIPQNIYNQSQWFANDAVARLQAFTNDLLTIALTTFNIPLPKALDASINIDSAKDALDAAKADLPVAPTIPVLDDIIPPDPPVIAAIPDPVLPTIPDFEYNPEDIDPDALWNAARDREMIKLNELLEGTRREYAASGFPLPQGILAKTINRARLQTQMVLSDFNRDIPLKTLEVYKAEGEVYRVVVDGKKAMIDAVIAEFQAKVQKALADIQLYDAEIKAYAARLDLIKAKADIVVNVYRAQVEGYAAETNALAKAFELEITALEKEWQVTIAQLTANIELAKTQLEQIVEATKLREAAAAAGADVFKNLAAAALSANHMVAQISASESFQTSFNNSNQYSFNRSTQDQDTETITPAGTQGGS